MKHFKIFIFTTGCWLTMMNLCPAQEFNLIKATRQRWNGGVVGNWGINYYIEIETRSHTITPDTVWINGKVYPISFSDKNSSCKKSVDSINHKTIFEISEGEAHRDARMIHNHLPADTQSAKPDIARPFEGAALISYIEKHKQHFFIVKFFTQLPPLNYP
jgi:hypothetical protein